MNTAQSNNLNAVILLSGGLDSATVLALASQQGYRCHAISVEYGQTHNAELNAAQEIAQSFGVIEHKRVSVDLGAIGGSALTDHSIAIPESQALGIPVTYVPARNTVFLAIALGYAETIGASTIFIGANAVDYSGYPDCRPQFIEAFEKLANVATKAAVEGHSIQIKAPLIDMSKAQIILAGLAAGVDYSRTISCYQADNNGLACGLCDSCTLRKQGFIDAQVDDSTRYQSAG